MYYGATKASSQCHAGNILLWRNGRARRANGEKGGWSCLRRRCAAAGGG